MLINVILPRERCKKGPFGRLGGNGEAVMSLSTKLFIETKKGLKVSKWL